MTSESDEAADRVAEFQDKVKRARDASLSETEAEALASQVVELATELREHYTIGELVRRTGVPPQFFRVVEKMRDLDRGQAIVPIDTSWASDG